MKTNIHIHLKWALYRGNGRLSCGKLHVPNVFIVQKIQPLESVFGWTKKSQCCEDSSEKTQLLFNRSELLIYSVRRGKPSLMMSLPVLCLQVRCGGSARWFRPLRATAGPAPRRWSSGSPVPSVPATGGSTVPGPSVGWRCVNTPWHHNLIQPLIINGCMDVPQQKCSFDRSAEINKYKSLGQKSKVLKAEISASIKQKNSP